MSQFPGSQIEGGQSRVTSLLAGVRRVLWLKLFLVTAVIVGVAFPIFGQIATNRSNEVFLASERARLERSLYVATNQIRLSFFEAELLASKIENLIATSKTIPRRLIERDVDTLVANNQSVIAVALAPDLVVSDTFPLTANQSTVGLVYPQVHRQMASIARAYRQGSPMIVGPVPLVQGGIGYILRYPVFLPQPGLATERFWGLISVVIKADGLISNHAAAFDEGEELSFRLRETRQRAMSPDFGMNEIWQGDQDPVIVDFKMAGNMWRAAAAPAGGWPTTSPQGSFILLASILITIASVLGLLILHRVSESHQKDHTLLRESISSMNEGFVAFDEDGRLVMANQRFKDYYPKIADELVLGATFKSLLEVGVAKSQFPEAVGREDDWIAERLRLFEDPHGSFIERICEDHWVKVTEAKTPYGYTVGIRTDVTAEKLAMDAAESAAREKTNFISNVSHELRTPLTVIVGRASFLQNQDMLSVVRQLESLIASSDAVPEEVRSAIGAYKAYVADQGGKIVAASRHMIRLVEDLLDWTTVERGQLQIQKEVLSASALTDDVADELRPLAQAKGLSLRYIKNAEVDVMADRARLRQILYNLLSNAIKFTDQGHVELSLGVVENDVVICISDTGCGIPEEDLERVFERFQQVDTSDTRLKGGFGLGLSIAKQLAVLHDGELTVSSQLGVGSCFQLTLPLYRKDTTVSPLNSGQEPVHEETCRPDQSAHRPDREVPNLPIVRPLQH
ncbi:CHASE domain-containing protein [Loktanella fryxellensis]|uniref:histidine kinase n=1 Tax=Loktanella fryxellensis TaxID=245187 RepID=A0A1H8IRC5_9RHOB|nr:ATP-binding protein [Loktanella fryxellensis]SEN70546.1 CHASE domain-containing protein [Loktanella fryxellensis]